MKQLKVKWWVDEMVRRSNTDLLGLRASIRDEVINCSLPLAGPSVPFSGPVHPNFLAMGEAPGRTEVAKGEPFIGAAGRVLRNYMNLAGIDVDRVMFSNVVCKEPRDSFGKNRPPSDDEIKYCHWHFEELLTISGRFVLLVGATALNTFRPDLKVTKVHGRVMVWRNQFIVMPVVHPAAILRNPNLSGELQQDLIKWGKVVKLGDQSALGLVGAEAKCGWCDSSAGLIYDADGVGYCSVHKKKGQRKKDGRLNDEQLSFGQIDSAAKPTYL